MPPATEVIRTRSHPLVRRLRALKETGGRDGEELALLEGPKLLEEAVISGIAVVEVAATPRVDHGHRGHRILRELEASGTPVRWMHEEVLASLSEAETSQGILALARRPRDNEAAIFTEPALALVAVGIQNPGNLGGLIRTAEAAGATGAFLTPGCADPFSWKALRGSMGSAFRLPLARGVALEDAIGRAHSRGLHVVACSADGPVPYDETDLRRPVALLFGNESAGLPDSVSRQAEIHVRIPMCGRVQSLNVGVAAGILLFEAARQRRG